MLAPGVGVIAGRKIVEQLDIGDDENPLDGLIDPGDRVFVKVNLCSDKNPCYTRPEVVRPVIDMIIAAGAASIKIGDGGSTYPETEEFLSSLGYVSIHPQRKYIWLPVIFIL